MALRLAYRLALAGLRHEQRKHVVHSPEHSEYLASLVATTIIERIGGTRVASLTRVALITPSRSYLTSHLQHAPTDPPFLLGSQAHLD